jgi:hypothetical protein
MKNTEYTNPEDLLTDIGFIAWYYHSNEKDVHEWNKWIATGLLNRHLAADAVYLLARRNIENSGITDHQIKLMAKHFINSIVGLQKNEDDDYECASKSCADKIQNPLNCG